MIAIRWMWAFLDTPRGLEPALEPPSDRAPEQPDAPLAHGPVHDTGHDAGHDPVQASWAFWSVVTRSELAPVRGADGEFSTLLPRAGDPWVKLQAVRTGPGGVHVDLDVDDPQSAALAAGSLGATRVTTIGDSVVVMSSPGGLPFCLTRHARPGELRGGRQVRAGEPDLLDQVCIDVPGPDLARETSFWAELTGWRWMESDVAGFSYLRRPAEQPLRFLFQELDDVTGTARAHVDIACVDRAATRALHVRHGATVLAERAFWTVLRDPAGRPYCLTDRSPVQDWVTTQ